MALLTKILVIRARLRRAKELYKKGEKV